MSSFKFALSSYLSTIIFLYICMCVHIYREDISLLLPFPGPPLNLPSKLTLNSADASAFLSLVLEYLFVQPHLGFKLSPYMGLLWVFILSQA